MKRIIHYLVFCIPLLMNGQEATISVLPATGKGGIPFLNTEQEFYPALFDFSGVQSKVSEVPLIESSDFFSGQLEYAKIADEGFRTRDAPEIIEKSIFLECEPVWRYFSFSQIPANGFVEGKEEWISPSGQITTTTFSDGPAPPNGWTWLRYFRHYNNLPVGTYIWKLYQKNSSGIDVLVSTKNITVVAASPGLACSEKIHLPLNGNTNDISGAGNSITIQGGSILYGPDHFNNCNSSIRLSGGKYLEAPVINERAVSFWFKLNQQEQMVIYDSGPGGFESKDWEIGVYKPNGLGTNASFDNTFGLFFATWDRDIAIPFDDLKTGWHFIAISRDDSGYNRFRIMIDGQFPAGYMYDGYPTVQTWFPQTQPFDFPSGGYGVPNLHTPSYKTYIGKDFENRKIWETGLAYFDGWLDEVRVFGQLLDVGEMTSLYNSPSDGIASSVVTTPTCSGQSNGSATVTVTGGVPPFTYAWSNGQSGQTATNLSAGNYTVTVTATGGCSTTASATISSLPGGLDCGLVARYKFDNAITDASGNNNNGSAANGIVYTNDRLGNCNQAGSFNGTNAYVTVPSSTSLNSPTTSITLAGWAKAQTSTDGLYSIFCKGILGANVIQYRLGVTFDNKMYFSYPTSNGQNFGDILQPITGSTIQNWNHYAVTFDGSNVRFYLNGAQVGSAQPLTTTIQAIPTAPLEIGRDAPGLGNEYLTGALDELRIYSRALTATEIQQIYNLAGDTPISATISATSSACSGLSNGSATVTVSGGVTPYTYKWSNNQTTATATNLTAGAYVVTVTGNNGCTATATATVSTASAPTANISATTAACTGLSNGSATVTASGGTTPYTYKWSNNQTTATATNLFAGTYTITVTGNNGCTITATATVSTASVPTANISATTAACTGMSNGSATVTASGGTTPYTYKWSNNQTTATATNLFAGTYTITVTGNNGCTTTAAATVGVSPMTLANFTFSVVGQTVHFTNTSTNASSYLWDLGKGETSTQTQPVVDFEPGVHQVCLIAAGICGPDTTCQTVTIAPPGWDVQPCNTGTVHTIAVWDSVISNIAGQPLEAGDLIGFFYTGTTGLNICSNFGAWQNTTLTLEVCGDNPATTDIKEGYSPGENFLVRIWKDTAEYNIIPCYVPEDTYNVNNPNATGSFAPFGLSYIDCLKTAPTPGTSLGCDGPIPIACGETKTGNTTNGRAAAIAYNCFYNLVDGPEVVYEFTNPVTQNVLITLTGLQEDLEVLLLDACDRNSCILYSDRTGIIPEALVANNLPAGTYYIIVEGYLGSDSPYILHLTCGSNSTDNGTLDCSTAIVAQCGQPISGNTNTGTDQIVQYGCTSVYNSGKEKIYSLTLPENKAVSATLSGLSNDLNLIVLGSCNPNDCIAFSSRSGTESDAVLFSATAGKTYYFVVDGYFDAEGPFSLYFSCFDPCTDCPTNDYDLNGPAGSGGGVCEQAQVLQCGIPVSGNNNTGNAYADYYTCPNSYSTGKEVIYKFTTTETQDITLILSGLSANLDLYLLDECTVLSCHASSHKIGNSDEGMVLQALPAGTYYVVVDGYNNAVSSYSLVVNCSNTALVCQQIHLVAGVNFVSSNIVPNIPAINEILLPSAESKIISIESQGNLSYSPIAQTDPGVFGDWDVRKAYRIKAIAADSFNVCGVKADPDTPIPFVALTPQGQTVNNWSAYLKDEPAQVSDKFTQALTPNIFRVWNMPTGPAGTLTPQAWLVTAQSGTDFQLKTGRGYILNASMDGEYSFGLLNDGVAERSSGFERPMIVENGCRYFQTPLFNSMKSATVIIPKAVLEQNLHLGDEIGVYRQDGSLFGSGLYNGFGISMVISGDETATPGFSEGFAAGENMIFRLWKSREQEVFELKVTFQSGNGDFENEAVYLVKELAILEASVLQTPKTTLQWSVYPNPASEILWFDLLLPQVSAVHLDILSSDGRQIREIINQEMPEGHSAFYAETAHLSPGCYLIKMVTGQDVSFKKIIISKK